MKCNYLLTCTNQLRVLPHLCNVSVWPSEPPACRHRAESVALLWCHPYPEEGNARLQQCSKGKHNTNHWNDICKWDWSTAQYTKLANNSAFACVCCIKSTICSQHDSHILILRSSHIKNIWGDNGFHPPTLTAFRNIIVNIRY